MLNETPTLLFLDIVGVLHPVFPRDDRTDEENQLFSYRPRLERVLREFPDVQIVIASDWRKHHTLEELQDLFAADIAARIIGVTDIDDEDREIGNRQRAVERFIAKGLPETKWVAIDDDEGNYLPGATLVLCNDGFRDEEEAVLRAALRGLEIPTPEMLVREGREADVVNYIRLIADGLIDLDEVEFQELMSNVRMEPMLASELPPDEMTDEELAAIEASPSDIPPSVLAQATKTLGSEEIARQWFTRPHLALAKQRPIDVLATADGTKCVEELLTRIEHGVYT